MLEKSSGAYDFPLSTSPFSTSKEWFFTLRYKGYEEKTHIRVGIFLKPGGGRGGWILGLRVWGQTGMTTTGYSDLQERENRLNLDF